MQPSRAPAADRLETEAFVEADRMVVGVAHLERDPASAERVGALHERREQHCPVSLGVIPGAYADGGDMGFERHAPEARIPDDVAVLTKHDV